MKTLTRGDEDKALYHCKKATRVCTILAAFIWETFCTKRLSIALMQKKRLCAIALKPQELYKTIAGFIMEHTLCRV